jgi:hypothetical protein
MKNFDIAKELRRWAVNYRVPNTETAFAAADIVEDYDRICGILADALDGRVQKLLTERDNLKTKLDFLKSKGLIVGMMKTSDKPEPYLAYVIEPDSELCNMRTVNALIDCEIERDGLKQKLEELSQN